jgi:AcrR family transcriptional regulator
MPAPPPPPPARRADAERNRGKILGAARTAFAEADGEVSMAEVARRAGVGMATLYRNFAGRRELLEALYVDEVDAIVDAAGTVGGETPGAVLEAWLRRFIVYFASKGPVAAELLAQADDRSPVFGQGRPRVLAAGRTLMAAAQDAGEVRRDLTLEQVLDLVIATARISGDPAYAEPLLRTVFDGLRPRTDPA